MAYSYYASITVDSDKVSGSSNLSNFPVLVSGTYDGTGTEPDIRTTANSGHVQNTTTGGISGSVTIPADLVFSPNTDGSSPYDFEIVSYDASTGEIIAWVRIPTLSYSADTTLYMCYGDSGVTTSQEDIDSTWRSEYKLVLHLEEDVYKDSSGNGNDGTNNGTTNATGQIGGGKDFDDADEDYIEVADSTDFNFSTLLVVSCWMDIDSLNGNDFIINKYATDKREWALRLRSGGSKPTVAFGDSNGDFSGWYTSDSDEVSLTGFHKVTFSYSSGTVKLYIDGQPINASVEGVGSIPLTLDNEDAPIRLGWGGSGQANNPFDGVLDEVTLYAGSWSDDLEETRYNAESSPSTFYTMGAEQGGAATTTSTSTSTSTSSSTSTTTTSTSTSTTTTSTSTSTTTTTTLDPTSGGLAFGEENPDVPEIATSWQTWVTTGEITGDSDWGKIAINITENGYSKVYDYGNATERTYTLEENKYGTGQGLATLQIRGDTSTFDADDAVLEWENYTIPISREWRYIQVRVIKNS